MHREDQRRASAIVLERFGLDRIGHDGAVGELADAAGRIASDAPPEAAVMRIAHIAVGDQPVLDGEGVAAHMQHGKSSVSPAQRHALAVRRHQQIRPWRRQRPGCGDKHERHAAQP